MTKKELKRLSRKDLLEMLLDLSRENEQLREENEIMSKRLENRYITTKRASSLAEAAMQMNGVFQAAQDACDQYTWNIRTRYEAMEKRCRAMEQKTRAQCEKMIEDAKEQADAHWRAAEKRIQNRESTYAWLAELLDDGEKK